ncbi:uncharacterized protein LOC121865189 [Homarus americanus]|uniref:uncharacterized protein LOC121865189 n=1 Tax=Homarus americanus TaxID=6706 RepID=UPI001C46726C|nr:uncharacterized protein LOC121865189 [Homarus americanus]
MHTIICTSLLLSVFGLSGGEKCKTKKAELDTCLAEVAPLMPKVGLPHTLPELINMCRAFKGGMRCVDHYTSSCLTTTERTELDQNLRGARSFLAFLCDDPIFRKEYLSHGACLRDVSDDWERCLNHFKSLVRLQHKHANISQAARDHNICCFREGLLSCVYSVSYFRCEKHAALFVKKVTATLSYNDVQEEKCRNVTIRTCAATSRHPSVLPLLLAASLFLLHQSPP